MVNGLNQITREPSVRGSLWVAGSVAALITIATALLLPISDYALREVKPFLPMFAMTVFNIEYLTAYLLFTHFRSTREPFFDGAFRRVIVRGRHGRRAAAGLSGRIFGHRLARCGAAERGVVMGAVAWRLCGNCVDGVAATFAPVHDRAHAQM